MLEALRDSWPGVFEAETIEEGRGLHLRDLATGDLIFVHDVTASPQTGPRGLHPYPDRKARRQADVRLRWLLRAARGTRRIPQTHRQGGGLLGPNPGGIRAPQRQPALPQDPEAERPVDEEPPDRQSGGRRPGV